MESKDVEMNFWEHLEELRRRIIISLVALGVFTVLGLSFTKPIKYVLELPMKSPMMSMVANAIEASAGSEGSTLGFLALALRSGTSSVEAEIILAGPFQSIMAFLTIGITTGILLSLPIILYQIWMYVFPALYRSEQRLVVPLFFTIVFFFILGAVFAYFVVVPVVLQFAAGLFQYKNLWDLKFYITFVTQLILGFGVAFELPIVMAFLARIGVIDSKGFRGKQRFALLGICVISALLTPADPGSMLLMAIPLFILYQLGIFFAFLVEKEAET
ncbi:MAG: twin-arginine translocase subunit TatC [Candidatus Poribacteria bacterium]|nr:twin-arginine translocase subunit TatC [Candidatus Poribacteria bacterium]